MTQSTVALKINLLGKSLRVKPIYLFVITILSSVIGLSAKSQGGITHVSYQCEKGQSLQVTFLAQSNIHPSGAAMITFPDGKLMTLPRVVSASGARYSDGTTTFWTKGDGAFVEVNEKITINDCVVLKQDTSSVSRVTQDKILQGTSWILVRWGSETAPTTPLNNTTITAEFTPDTIRGSGGCNRYNGGYQSQNGSLSFGAIASTRKACEPEIMEQEGAYFNALAGAKSYQINPQGELEISYQTEQGAGVIVFKPISAKSRPIRGMW